MNENEKHSYRSFTRSSLNKPKITCFLNCCILLVFYYNHTCYEAIHAVGQHFWTLFTSSIPCHPDRRRSHPRRSREHCLLRTRLAQANSSSIDNSPKTFGSRLVALQHCSWAIWEVPSRHSSSDLASFTKTRQFEGLYTPYFRLVGNKVVFVAESLQAVYTEFWWKWGKKWFLSHFCIILRRSREFQ